MLKWVQTFREHAGQSIHIAPLAVLRIIFGALMLFSTIRFMVLGWVETQYLEPEFHFRYFGFEWVPVIEGKLLYLVFALMALSALMILLGAFYRVFAVLFFLTFTYVELIDKTYYLNHYYFITLLSFLMIWVPAHRYFSIDVWRKPSLKVEFVPRWVLGIFRLQIGMVYFFAGVAKINADWLLRAQPLSIWLPAKSSLPLIGGVLKTKAAAFFFSWMGCLFDLTVPFFLSIRKTRKLAYLAVVGFHIVTGILFPIGVFPWVMIGLTLIFFPPELHQKALEKLSEWGRRIIGRRRLEGDVEEISQLNLWLPSGKRAFLGILAIFFFIQVLLPIRHIFYPGKLFWTEEGFRFSWRVMLMEKAGQAFFYIKDPETGREGEVYPGDYLTPYQEKMMATQPDMILQFAHFIADEYRKKGIPDPEVRAEVYVTLNGSGSRPFTDPTINLAQVREGFAHRNWILPYAP